MMLRGSSDTLPGASEEDHALDVPKPATQGAVAIEAKGLCKVYALQPMPWAWLTRARSRPAEQGGGPPRTKHRAIDDVSFTIRKGETVGILGVNGAGKSTLLQMVTGTLTPTSGTIAIDGRISALLELGAGFNPEWSGRRNAEFQCIMSGVPRGEVAARVEAIAAFADIGDFFDQPTRTYSSGMFLRVAFASAISTEPDILIVDEALAVGDVKFQNKCFRRFEEMQAKGCTILFVTHAPDLVTRFCSRAMIMERGRVLFDGDVEEAVTRFFTLTTGAPIKAVEAHDAGSPPTSETMAAPPALPPDARAPSLVPTTGRLEARLNYNPLEKRSGSAAADIVDAMLHRGDFDELSSGAVCGETLHVFARIILRTAVQMPEFGLILRSQTGQILSGCSNRMLRKHDAPIGANQFLINWTFQNVFLGGDYFIDLGLADLADGQRTILDLRQSSLHFVVRHDGEIFGIVNPGFDLSVSP